MKCSVHGVGNGKPQIKSDSSDFGPIFGHNELSPEAYGPIHGTSDQFGGIESRPGTISGRTPFGNPMRSTIHALGDSVEDVADIRLISGASATSSQIEFNPGNYHWTLNGYDITNDIKRADKLRMVPDFDIERENRRLSSEAPASNTPSGAGTDPLTESTLGIFTDQIFHDPLGAPLATLDKGIGQLVGSSGIQTIVIVGVLALVGYMMFQKEMSK